MIFIQLGVGSFVCSVPGGQVNTSHPKTQKNTISTETRDQGLPDSKNKTKQKTGGLLSVSATGLCQKKASSPKCLSPTVFPLGKSSTSVRVSIWNPNLWLISWMAQTTWQSSSDVLGAFPLGLTSPTARPPYSDGRGPAQQGTSDGSSESELRWNKTKDYICFVICAKGTLTELWAIWKWKLF